MSTLSRPVAIAVLGAGAWGTALAIHLAKNGHVVRMWERNPQQAARLQKHRQNERYLRGVTFPENLTILPGLAETVQSADAVLVVVPSHVFRDVLKQLVAIHPFGQAWPHFAWATKGFEPDSRLLLHQIVEQQAPEIQSMAVLSGPTFADEVARGLPTAMVSASATATEAQFWADAFHCDTFRMYTQSDVVGVEVGGAYKNIMAIATGLSDGLHLGANARAALIGRGMKEMMRFGAALGAEPETLMGLAGLGDLVLTCTDNLSRNRRFGLKMAQTGLSANEVIHEIGQVVEGVKAAKAVKGLADEQGLDLPIMEQVNTIISGEKTAQQAVKALMDREGRSETERF